MKDNTAITVSNVSKSFKLPHEKTTSIKSIIASPFKRRTYEKQEVLNDISFSIKKGEFFGIVGRNGSGKSTLLKLLAGIYSPNKGSIQVNGKLTPFIELGVGFNPELTGRENVYLNGALLGFNRKEMDAMYAEIVDFAELHKFMDQKLKNYSSGMQVRLAFSIAIRAKSDILLIDEVLAVGDSAFQKKCFEVFARLKKAKKTIVFVTHDMSSVERFCDRVLVINKGRSEGVMQARDAGAFYDELNAEKSENMKNADKEGPRRWGTGKVLLDKLVMFSGGKRLINEAVEMGQDLELRMTLSGETNRKVIIGLAFEDVYGANIAGPNSKGVSIDASKEIIYKIDKLSLVPGDYKITLVVFDKLLNEYDHHDRAFALRVKAKDHNIFGKVNLFGRWYH